MNTVALVIGRERAPDFIDNFFPLGNFDKRKRPGRALQAIEVLVQFEDAAVIESEPSQTASPPCTAESNGLIPPWSRWTSRPLILTIRSRFLSSNFWSILS